MLSATNKPIMLSVVMLNVIMLIVVAPKYPLVQTIPSQLTCLLAKKLY